MLTKIRSHASFSNMVALTALFVALGGTSYAATRIGSKQISNNSVRSVDIKNRTIRSRDIAKGVIGTTLQSTAAQAVRDAGPSNVAASQSFTPVATLGGLEPGAYVLLAKVNQSSDSRTEGRCRIQAEGDYDDSNRGLRENTTPEGAQPPADPHLRRDRDSSAGLPLLGGHVVGRRREAGSRSGSARPRRT